MRYIVLFNLLVVVLARPNWLKDDEPLHAGFLRGVGEFLGLPNPIHIALYLGAMILLLVLMIVLMCYGVNCIYFILFLLLAICVMALFVTIYYWIGLDEEDIPEFHLPDVLNFTSSANVTTVEPVMAQIHFVPFRCPLCY